MPLPTPRPSRGALVLAVALACPAARAATLDDFLAGAVANDPTLAVAEARTDGARADATVARARLLPRLEAKGGYTRNQFAAEIDVPETDDKVVIQAVDQLDASVRLDVPLVDGAAIAGATAASRCARAAASREAASRQAVLLDVVADVHEALAQVEVLRAAQASQEAAEAVLARASERRAEGLGSELDVLRATSDVARAREVVAGARADLQSVRRRLEARTGVSELPEPSAPRPLPVDEGADPLAHPDLASADAELSCSKASLAETRWGYAPRIGGFAEERLTNATGFVGQPAAWSVGVQASWNLVDGGAREGRMAKAAAARREAEAQRAQVERSVIDGVAEARDRLTAATEGLAAAEARRAAASEALRVARERQEVGLSTMVEVSLALRDDFDAAVGVARAVATRAVAVETLRVALGQPLVGGGA